MVEIHSARLFEHSPSKRLDHRWQVSRQRQLSWRLLQQPFRRRDWRQVEENIPLLHRFDPLRKSLENIRQLLAGNCIPSSSIALAIRGFRSQRWIPESGFGSVTKTWLAISPATPNIQYDNAHQQADPLRAVFFEQRGSSNLADRSNVAHGIFRSHDVDPGNEAEKVHPSIRFLIAAIPRLGESPARFSKSDLHQRGIVRS